MAKSTPDLPGSDDSKPASTKRQTGPVDLRGMPLDELLDLRSRIEALLPAKSLQDMDLQRELVLQVLALQALQQRVLGDNETPANQQAQCANSLSAALANLVKVQTGLYTSERLKRVEALLIATLDEMPKDSQEQFLAKYEELLEDGT